MILLLLTIVMSHLNGSLEECKTNYEAKDDHNCLSNNNHIIGDIICNQFLLMYPKDKNKELFLDTKN